MQPVVESAREQKRSERTHAGLIRKAHAVLELLALIA
jgi:hypothetical protein